ncbi:RNA-directed DNA polymerase, eukaryota, reverse transcriptase zinc-binding domain protein [Tanacetum coccineum]
MCRRVTEKEIWEALVSIDDNKAPGPDGYTTKFYKAAGSVVGKEVEEAIQEFFQKGMLLNEVNATLITLVPKVKSPMKVSEYRPIACCNADDTVNWNFFESVLRGFGFPNNFIKWVMICVRTSAFLFSLNGGRFGYFKKRRGLRQGDPISPYVFTIVMEMLNLILERKINQTKRFTYHYGCEELKITNLCFVDDLLIMSNGDANLVQATTHQFCIICYENLLGLCFFPKTVIKEINRLLKSFLWSQGEKVQGMEEAYGVKSDDQTTYLE